MIQDVPEAKEVLAVMSKKEIKNAMQDLESGAMMVLAQTSVQGFVEQSAEAQDFD